MKKLLAFTLIVMAFLFGTQTMAQCYCNHCYRVHSNAPKQRNDQGWNFQQTSSYNQTEPSWQFGYAQEEYEPRNAARRGVRFLDGVEQVVNIAGQVIGIIREVRELKYSREPVYNSQPVYNAQPRRSSGWKEW